MHPLSSRALLWRSVPPAIAALTVNCAIIVTGRAGELTWTRFAIAFLCGLTTGVVLTAAITRVINRRFQRELDGLDPLHRAARISRIDLD